MKSLGRPREPHRQSTDSSSQASSPPRTGRTWLLPLGVVASVAVAGFLAAAALRSGGEAVQETTAPATAGEHRSSVSGTGSPHLPAAIPEPSSPLELLAASSEVAAPEPPATPPVPSDNPPQRVPEPPAEPPKSTSSGPARTPVSQLTAEAIKKEEIEVASRLVEDFPGSADAMVLMGNVYGKHGNSAEATRWWQRSLELDGDRADAYGGMAKLAMRRGQSEQAAELWRKALEIDASMPGAHYGLACALMSLSRPGEAVGALEKDVAISPEAGQSHFLLGQAYLQTKEYEKAKAAYLKAIALRPDSWNAHYGLATVCARLKQADESAEYRRKFKELKAAELEVHIDRNSASVDLLLLRRQASDTHTDAGRFYRSHGRLPQATELWQRAAALDPDNVACRVALVSLYRSQKRTTEALRLCEQLRALEPDSAMHCVSLAVLQVEQGRFEAAEREFRRAAELAPDRSWGQGGLAQLYLHMNQRLGEAKTYAAKAVQLDPVAPNYAVLSEACDKTGDLPGALAAMKQAVQLDPENARYRRIYGLLQKKR